MYHRGAGIKFARRAAALLAGKPYIQDVRIGLFTHPLPNVSCMAMASLIENVGLNGALGLVPLEQWHMLGQVAGHVAISTNSVKEIFHVLIPLLKLSYESPHFQANPQSIVGAIHAFCWSVVANRHFSGWHELLDLLGIGMISHPFLHGVGHGFHFRQSVLKGHSFFSCSPPPMSKDRTDLSQALSLCMQAPRFEMSVKCSQGAFHSWIEYSTGFYGSGSWYFPCTEVHAMPSWCFALLFGQGLWCINHEVNFLRSLSISAVPGHITRFCVGTNMSSEIHVRGCIWGMSAQFYLYFHEGWQAMILEPGTNAALQRCLELPIYYSSTTVSAINCHLLFAYSKSHFTTGSQQHFTTTGTKSSLIDWCSLFVPGIFQRQQHRLTYMRWIACIHGAFSFNSFIPLGRGVPLSALVKDCKHDLPWHVNSSWRSIEEFCRKAPLLRPSSRWPADSLDELRQMGLVKKGQPEFMGALGFTGWNPNDVEGHEVNQHAVFVAP